MCYIILARSIKRGFKTGVNLLRQVCTFVLSPFFMQKCDGIRHNYYLIQTERTVNFMTKNEVIELVKSGRLRGFLPPEMAQYEVNVEQMGSYTGIVLVNPDRAMERLQFINSEEEVAELLAGSMNRFIQAAPHGNIDIEGLREKLSSYEAAKPYIFMDAVSHNYSNDRAVVYEKNGMKFVPKLMVSNGTQERSVSAIPKEWLLRQGISEERLIQDAISNTANVTSVSINSMSDIFSNMNADFEISAMPETMLVVTNANKTGGASLILDDNVRQRVSELYGGNDFFVIPSSIHEVITLPVGNTILSPASTFSPFQPDSETLQSIMEMVSEVNETLEDEEILGYSVSIYDADKHELEKGTEYCINKQIDKVRNLRINELKEMGEIQPDIKPDNDNPKL